MARVLITGASGLLGSTLAPFLAQRQHDVVRASRASSGDVRLDLLDVKGLHQALDAISPEVIVNLAALTDVDECERNPQLAYAANGLTVEHIVSWLSGRERGCHLIQVSTDQLYDGGGPHAEEDIRPINYYAFSKYVGELLAARALATVLRTNLFGRSRCSGRVSLSDWIVAATTRHEPLKVFEDVYFSPLSLGSLSEMIGIAVNKRIPGTFNVGARTGMSKADFAFALLRALSLPTDTLSRVRASEASLTARRPSDMRMNVERFERHFGVSLPTLQSEINLMRHAYADA